jgi:transposase
MNILKQNGLTDKQWKKIKAYVPVRKKPWRKKDRIGGRPLFDERKCFEGMLWMLKTGAPWSKLPERFGASSTVHRRLQRWEKDGTLEKLSDAFLIQLPKQKQVRWIRCFLLGAFTYAHNVGLKWARQYRGEGRTPEYWIAGS